MYDMAVGKRSGLLEAMEMKHKLRIELPEVRDTVVLENETSEDEKDLREAGKATLEWRSIEAKEQRASALGRQYLEHPNRILVIQDRRAAKKHKSFGHTFATRSM